jgi:hypothetical protein
MQKGCRFLIGFPVKPSGDWVRSKDLFEYG